MLYSATVSWSHNGNQDRGVKYHFDAAREQHARFDIAACGVDHALDKVQKLFGRCHKAHYLRISVCVDRGQYCDPKARVKGVKSFSGLVERHKPNTGWVLMPVEQMIKEEQN